MDSGYVCDFSDKTFRDFILENADIDIYIPSYEEGGTSKANRLRTLWRKESDRLSAKVIRALLDYWKTKRIVSNAEITSTEEILFKEGLKIADRLEQVSSVSPSLDNKEIKKSLNIFLNDPRFEQRKFESIKEHFPINEPALRATLLEIGAIRFRNGDGAELWGFQPEGGKHLPLEATDDLPTPENGHITLKLTESTKNNVFINSHIHGGVEIAGQGNSFIETQINTLKEEHPFWYWFGILGTFIGIITGLMFLAQYFGILPDSWSKNLPLISTSADVATTTPKVSDIFSRYNEMSRTIDQQEFLKNYMGVIVYGIGTFNNIAGSFGMDNNYYLYLNVPGALVSCGFENADEVTKRRLNLLRAGSRVSFVGIFTGSTLNGGNSWYIRDCSFAD